MYATSDTKDVEKKPSRNRLAVFEQIPCKEKLDKTAAGFKRQPFKRSHTSPDNDLVIDDEDTFALPPPKKRNRGVRLEEEPLNLICGWKDCQNSFTKYVIFIEHLEEHIENIGGLYPCLWDNCAYATPMLHLIKQHIAFHGYHTKLKNIGSNVMSRVKLPDCTIVSDFIIPQEENGYTCDWLECDSRFGSVYEFYAHMQVHIKNNPKYCAKGEIISCLWKGCAYKFSSQYKLSDHLRSHTKERVVACPTCGNMFATKTKFYDHCKRQLPIERQSYQCSQCSKLFPSERLLRDHMRSHINHYKCSMCDMTCTKPSMLATHVRYRHLMDRPLQCNLCEHRCVAKQDLEAHLLTHIAEKLLVCEECDFRCRSVHGLDRHYQKVHGEGWAPIYECHCCQMKFNRGNLLTKHLIKNHDFHWPSGHSRFRYKENTDGIFRLQTVRYESIEVTEEMMLTNSAPPEPSVSGIRYNLRKRSQSPDKTLNYVLMVAENGEKNVAFSTDNSILITINDVDERGNVLNCETMHSNEMKVMDSDL